MKSKLLTISLLVATLLLPPVSVAAAAELKDVAAKIDAATGKAADTAAEFTVEGVVGARSTLPDGSVLAVVLDDGAALPVLLGKGSKIKPRDAVRLIGKLADHDLGLAVLRTTKENVSGSDKPLRPAPRSLAEARDAAEFAGDYVVLTNVTFDVTDPKFSAGKPAALRDTSGTELKVIVGQSLDGRAKPSAPVNFFGTLVKTGKDGWAALPARFVPADSNRTRTLATKHTCMSCHQTDKKLLGPSYLEVAAKYRDDPDAVAKLTAQIENGGTGKWGAVPMAGFKGKIPAEEIEKLAQWVMDMRWDAVLSE